MRANKIGIYSMMIQPDTAFQLFIEGYLLLLGGVFGYAVLTWRLRSLSQPIRLQFAKEAEALLARKVLPERETLTLRFMLDNAYNGWLPWAMFPVFTVVLAAEILGLIKNKPLEGIEDEKLRNDVMRLYHDWTLATCGLSPFAALLIRTELLIAGLIVMPKREGRALRSAIAYVGNHLDAKQPSGLVRG